MVARRVGRGRRGSIGLSPVFVAVVVSRRSSYPERNKGNKDRKRLWIHTSKAFSPVSFSTAS
jgi:hypothetical protein